MSIFTKKSTLTERRASRDSLIKKLQTATEKLDAARINAMSLAADGADDSERSKANSQIQLNTIDVDVLQNALQATEDEVARLEAEEKHKADKIEREATASSLNKMAEVYEKAIKPLTGVLQGILSAYENAKAVTGETGMPVILTNMAQEVTSAVATIVAELRARANQTLAGSAPPSLPAPFIPEVVQPEPVVPTTQIFSLATLQYKDAHGRSNSLVPRIIDPRNGV